MPEPQRFLQHIARCYTRPDELPRLPRTLFLFPNRRSVHFFERELRGLLRRSRHTIAGPQVSTLGEWVAALALRRGITPVDETDALLILYNEYSKISSTPYTFDAFRRWGQTLLSDFADVDLWMADAADVFRNIKELKEIQANYLTPEQREAIRRYWPTEHLPTLDGQDLERFWRHTGTADGPHTRFVKMWEELYPLYRAFTATLRTQHLATDAMMHRDAAEALAEDDAIPGGFVRVVFAGFTDLPAADRAIMLALQRRGCADFYWDLRSPAFATVEQGGLGIGRMMRRWAADFPSRYPLEVGNAPWPDITILASPSRTDETVIAAHVINTWIDEGHVSDPANAIDTAVVLADQNMHTLLAARMPERIKRVNVTVGLPMRNTAVAHMLRSVITMQMRAWQRKKEGGQVYFLSADVKRVLSDPMLRALAPDVCRNIEKRLDESRRRAVTPASSDKDPAYGILAPIFAPVAANPGQETVDEAFGYVNRVLELLRKSPVMAEGYNAMVLDMWAQTLRRVRSAIERRGIAGIGRLTLLQLIERIVSRRQIALEGHPLQGLQVMGMLETRALDFDNVLVMSMNDRIYPGHIRRRTFIPEALRRAYGLPTAEYDEAMAAANLYRLLGATRRLTITYDARTVGARSGEMSRYLIQMLYLAPRDKVRIRHLAASTADTPVFRNVARRVEKDAEVMEQLERFTLPLEDENARRLSASALKHYLTCPLQFYVNDVLRLDIDIDETEYIDAAAYGTVVHEVLRRIYDEYKEKNGEVPVTAAYLQQLLDDPTELSTRVKEAVNLKYYKRAKGTELLPDDAMVAQTMERIVRATLEADKEFLPFTYLEGEKKHNYRYVVDDDLTVNFRYVIDRVDRLADGRVRLIDYKTGSDETNFSRLEQLFGSQHNHHAIFQLLLYCRLYAADNDCTDALQPMIYKLQDVVKERSFTPIKRGGKKTGDEVLDHREYDEEFAETLHEMLREIFNPEIPFLSSSDPKACTFCSLKDICAQ